MKETAKIKFAKLTKRRDGKRRYTGSKLTAETTTTNIRSNVDVVKLGKSHEFGTFI